MSTKTLLNTQHSISTLNFWSNAVSFSHENLLHGNIVHFEMMNKKLISILGVYYQHFVRF